MTACISQHGEYSDHVPDDAYTCTRCGVPDLAAALRAKLRALRAERDATHAGESR